MTRVLIADDEEAVRRTISVILGAESDLEVVGSASDGKEALDMVDRTRPDVVVMDLRMPGMDGLAATRRLVTGPPPVPAVLALTTFATDEVALDAIRAGAAGFCAKADPPEVLAAAVRTVASGDAVVSPPVLRDLLERLVPPPAPVPVRTCSQREAEILGVVAEGASNYEIGRRLYISEATVRTHVQHLREKLSARSRAELVVRAYELGVAHDPAREDSTIP
ncbi:MAG: response regulator [Acidimicrobiales bacterium]